jgi:hypothetical protein
MYYRYMRDLTILALLCLGVLLPGRGIAISTPDDNGLRGSLHADRETAPIGDTIVFRLDLTFDPIAASPGTRWLNRYFGSYQFNFVDMQTGATFQREPIDPGGPLILPQPEDQIELSARSPASLDIQIHLLSEKGEQIPPGRYEVRVLYTNEIKQFTQPPVDTTGFWKGQIESSPCTLTVTSASPESVDVSVPTGLLVDPKSRPSFIGWAFVDFRTVRVLKRPGFVLGTKMVFHGISNGGDLLGFTSLGSGPRPSDSPKFEFMHSDKTEQLISDKSSKIVIDQEIFESSVQLIHHWNPGAGDSKVLWTGQITQRVHRP